MRTADVLAPAASRMTVADRIVAEYAPQGLWVAETADLPGGSAIIGWCDHVRAGYDCPTITGTAPVLTAIDANFAAAPVVTFSGGYVSTTATFADGDMCLLVVFRDPSVSSAYEVLVDLAFANNATIYRDASTASKWLCGIIEPISPWGQSVTAADGGRPHAVFLRRSGTTHDVWVDGKQAATKVGSGSTCTAATLKIGGGASGSNYGGAIALVAKWASAPTDAALQAITRILRAKYMIGEEP